MHYLHTDPNFHGNRDLTLAAFDFKRPEMLRRSWQYESTQKSSSKEVVAQGVREVHGGAVTQFIAWWKYSDGTVEEFDDQKWSTRAAS